MKLKQIRKVHDALAMSLPLSPELMGAHNVAITIMNNEGARVKQGLHYFGLTEDATWISITKEQYKKLPSSYRMAVYKEA